MIGRLLPVVSNDLSKDDKDESVKSMGIIQNSYANVGEGLFSHTHMQGGNYATYRDLGDVEGIQETSEVGTDLLQAVLVGIMGVGLDGVSRGRRRSKTCQ